MIVRVLWILFVFLCVSISFYPLMYWWAEGKIAVLLTKSDALFANIWWKIGFYTHISFGGVALLSGWSQFLPTWRAKNLAYHRIVGKIYVLSVCLSGIAGLGIAFYATGGWITGLGFGSLAIIWLYTTILAYFSIRQKDLPTHQAMMLYSYAACFAAVTLRLWLPLLIMLTGEFIIAYKIVAWLCWIPNMIVAYIIHKQKT